MVILAVGIVGVYRAFLIVLHYQDYLLTRLHIANFLSSETSRLENDIISGKQVMSRNDLGRGLLPMNDRSAIIAEAKSMALTGGKTGPAALTLKVHWDQGDRSQDFSRSSLIYVYESK